MDMEKNKNLLALTLSQKRKLLFTVRNQRSNAFDALPMEHPEENVEEGEIFEDDDGDMPFLNLINMKKIALRIASLAANLIHTQCNVLLKTLREFPFSFNFRPRDARTIFNTPTVVVTRLIQRIAGGEYLHIDFNLTLEKKLKSLPAYTLHLQERLP